MFGQHEKTTWNFALFHEIKTVDAKMGNLQLFEGIRKSIEYSVKVRGEKLHGHGLKTLKQDSGKILSAVLEFCF